MGSVYIAEHIQLNRQVALKTLRADVADQDTATKRFEREARAASEIDHPNVVQVLDFGQLENGDFYYVMELLQGRDLSEVLRDEGPLPWERVSKMMRQLVKAFAAAHAHGIVHRDIKPANCFLLDPRPGLRDDHVKVLDFGIAKREEGLQDSQELTLATQVVGTAVYIAPEQVLSGKTDPRSDIYSLGVVLYELLCGRPPFRGDSAMQTITHHINTPPPPLRASVPVLAPEVEAFVMRMLTKNPDHRFQSMAEVEAALEHLVGSTEPATIAGMTVAGFAAPTQVTRAAGLGREQSGGAPRWLLPLAGALMLLGVFGWWGPAWFGRGEPEVQPEPPTVKPEPVEPELPELEAPPPVVNPFVPNWLDETFVPAPAGKSRCDGEDLPPRAWTARPGSLGGIVRDADNKPLIDAQVCAWLADADAPIELTSVPRCTKITEKSRGRYELSDLAPGNYELSTFAEGYLPKYKLPVCVWPGDKTRDVDVELDEGGVEVRGRVRDHEDRPIPGAMVTVLNGARALAIADNLGRYSLWVEEGALTLMAWAPGYSHGQRAGTALRDSFDIELEREALITGEVTMVGSTVGMSDVEVQALYKREDDHSEGVGLTSYTDENGEFRIAGLEPGTCWVRARIPDGPEHLVQLELGPGSNPRIPIELPLPKVEPPPPLPGGTGTETGDGDGDGTETGDGDGDTTGPPSPPPPPPPKVPVTFIAGRLKWAELRVAGKKKGFAEPTRTLMLPAGTLPVQYRQDGRWKDAGAITLEPGKVYEARLGRNGVRLIERIEAP